MRKTRQGRTIFNTYHRWIELLANLFCAEFFLDNDYVSIRMCAKLVTKSLYSGSFSRKFSLGVLVSGAICALGGLYLGEV